MVPTQARSAHAQLAINLPHIRKRRLKNVKFVDSSGLGTLLSCLRVLRARDGDMKLYGMNKQVKALFELVRMQRIFNIYDTAEEAIQAFE